MLSTNCALSTDWHKGMEYIPHLRHVHIAIAILATILVLIFPALIIFVRVCR